MTVVIKLEGERPYSDLEVIFMHEYELSGWRLLLIDQECERWYSDAAVPDCSPIWSVCVRYDGSRRVF